MPSQERERQSNSYGSRRNVFILGHDALHEKDVMQIYDSNDVRFHALLGSDELVNKDDYDIDGLLNKARGILDSFDRVDGIICHWDFPGTSLQSILCAEYGVPGPSLTASLKCAHKYWSRIEQRKIVPENTPAFCAVDPFDDDALEKVTIDFPFWIKPIKGYGSMLGFHIGNADDFKSAMEETRRQIRSLGDPFDVMLKRVDLPPELEGIGGNSLIAEQYVTGVEFAPEGFVQNGDCHVHGVIDMVIGPNGKSFERYEYPSTAPAPIQARAIDVSRRLMEHIGFDNGCFNIEFFWRREADQLFIIEINPRMSQSHSYLFEQVKGLSNHEVAIKVALGEKPHFYGGEGHFRRAAKFLHRRYDKQNMIATRVPEQADIEALQKEQPETVVLRRLEKGMQLADMKEQDPYSYVIADILIAANSQKELEEKYRSAAESLPFEFKPLGAPEQVQMVPR